MRFFKKGSSIILILLSILFFSLTAQLDMATVYYFCSILVGFIKVLGFLIIPLSRFVTISKSYLYLGIYIGGCGIFRLTLSLLNAVGIGNSVKEVFLLSMFLSAMEIIAIYRIINDENSELSNKEMVENMFLFVAFFIFISSFILINPALRPIVDITYKFRVILEILRIVLFSMVIINVHLCSENICKIVKKDMIMYLVIRIIYGIVTFFDNKSFIMFTLAITCIILTGYYIGEIFFICIIKNPNETLYKNLKFKNRDLGKALQELEVYSELIKEENVHINGIINSFPEAVGIFQKSLLISSNTRFKEIFNCFDEEQLLGKNFLDFIREDYKEQYFRRRAQIKVERRGEEIEYVLEFNGTEFIGEVVSSMIKRGGDDVLVCVIRDVTKKRLIEELSKTIKFKEDETKLKSEVLTNVSHEFKTPVHVIYSAIQMQEIYAKNKDIDNLMKFNFVIKQNCYRLIRLINNFIDITRFESGSEIKANIRTLNIVNLVEDTVDSVIAYCSDNKISIIFDTDSEEIYGDFDSDMMDRIMLNLLSNAIKYNVDNGEIFVGINETETEVIIKVKDTGVGISKMDLEKLFHRFERLDKSLCRKREGSGIGLNIVKSLVEHQNGKIEVYSDVGVGTTFVLTFPKIEVEIDSICYHEPREALIDKVSLELSDII